VPSVVLVAVAAAGAAGYFLLGANTKANHRPAARPAAATAPRALLSARDIAPAPAGFEPLPGPSDNKLLTAAQWAHGDPRALNGARALGVVGVYSTTYGSDTSFVMISVERHRTAAQAVRAAAGGALANRSDPGWRLYSRVPGVTTAADIAQGVTAKDPLGVTHRLWLSAGTTSVTITLASSEKLTRADVEVLFALARTQARLGHSH
jgi:hypothetical protein